MLKPSTKKIRTTAQNSKIIVFEGVDGVGKSTLIAQIKKRLLQQNHSVLVVSNPYGISKQSWSARLHQTIQSKNFYPLTQALLYAATIIENQKLYHDKRYSYVLIDRYIHSTLAYNVLYPALIANQSSATQDPNKLCRSLLRIFCHSIISTTLLPHKTFIIKGKAETFDLPGINLEVLEKAYDETEPLLKKLYKHFNLVYKQKIIINQYDDKDIPKQILKLISI